MKKYRWIIILSFFSFSVQFFVADKIFSLSIVNVFFQLLSSGLIGWVFAQYWNKYYNSSRITWWQRFFLLMIIGTLFMELSPYLGFNHGIK